MCLEEFHKHWCRPVRDTLVCVYGAHLTSKSAGCHVRQGLRTFELVLYWNNNYFVILFKADLSLVYPCLGVSVGIELWRRLIFLVSVKVNTSSSYLMESILNVHFSNHIKKKILQAALLQMPPRYQACFHGLHFLCVLGQYKYFRGRCGVHSYATWFISKIFPSLSYNQLLSTSLYKELFY